SPQSGLGKMQRKKVVSPPLRDWKAVGRDTGIADGSDRLVREEELILIPEDANESNKAKDRLIGVVGHDLRTPLTAILGWVAVFKERATDERMVRRGADVIERNAAIQLGLIEAVLDISRINAAKLELAIEFVDVCEIISDTLENFEPLALSKGVQLHR